MTKEPPALSRVCEFQSLAPFCLGKKPQMIIPILPKEKPADEDQEQEGEEEKRPSVPQENIKIVFASIFISQVAEIIDRNLVKRGNRGAAPPGADPNPKHDAIWPITKFHASNWPIAIRQLDMVNRNGHPAKL